MYIKLPKENKDEMIEVLKEYFSYEHSEDIGDLAAGNLLHFITKEMAPYFYNRGVKDARNMVEQKINSLDEDIRSLERPIGHNRG